jgi:hypothetical protein
LLLIPALPPIPSQTWLSSMFPLREVLDTSRFWGYEPYLAINRPANAGLFELALPALGSILFLVILVMRLLQNFSLWDVGLSILNLVLLAVMWVFVRRAQKMRIEWSKLVERITQNLDEERSKIVMLEP